MEPEATPQNDDATAIVPELEAEHQQSLEAGAQAQAGQAALSDQGHAQTLEQGQQAADLAPQPEPQQTGAQ